MESAAQQCKIRTIVTSKAFLAKARIEPMEGMVYVEDILKAPGSLAKLSALVAARLLPARLLASRTKPGRAGHRDLLQRQHGRCPRA